MAWPQFKTKIVRGAIIVFAIVFVAMLASLLFSPHLEPGRLRLPVGTGTPAIGLGSAHGLILASDGSLWSWGNHARRGWPVLGLGGSTNRSTTLRRIGTETNWTSISAGSAQNLAIKSDGTLWTWGYNVTGLANAPRAIRSPVPAAPGNDWKQAAAGGIHFAALKKDGTLWTWGNNWAGPLGIGSTNSSNVPVRVGSATNWIKVWAGFLETMAMQSDGSLWYWGENPNPTIAQGSAQILVPTRVSPDTNWVDGGFSSSAVIAIKSDGTLWVWGRGAADYTGATDPAQSAIPTRVGTDSDWKTVSGGTGGAVALTKKDDSLWLMDALDGGHYVVSRKGPRRPPQVRPAAFQKDHAACAAGVVDGEAMGVHGRVGVVLRSNGEVWTWGMVLGEPPSLWSRALDLWAIIAHGLGFRISPPGVPPVFRDKPWQLRNE